ncbi:L-2-amino-thiazoline-4-carboxylic acid hydrolase [Candidatus Bathyarchaeota archaeon]|nr:L-2-amino-thiazoline-4-carboxylic acid hydrolase [Candidatus Bathyarchaeota archaeon]
MSGNYYLENKGKVMRLYWIGEWMQRRVLRKRFPAEKVDAWLERSHEEFTEMLPDIPYIGGDENMMTKYLLITAPLIPLVRRLKEEGLSLRETGEVLFELSKRGFYMIPWPLRMMQRLRYYSEKELDGWRRQAEHSKRCEYPGDWVVEYGEGDGETRFTLTITECGILKHWRQLGLEEYVPYLCLTDYASWRSIGVNVRRTRTLANGHSCCDYVYLGYSSDSPRGWPPETMLEWTGIYEK